MTTPTIDTLDEIFGRFVVSNVAAPPNTPVLFVKREPVDGEEMIGIATLRDLAEARTKILACFLDLVKQVEKQTGDYTKGDFKTYLEIAIKKGLDNA